MRHSPPHGAHMFTSTVRPLRSASDSYIRPAGGPAKSSTGCFAGRGEITCEPYPREHMKLDLLFLAKRERLLASTAMTQEEFKAMWTRWAD